MPIRFTSKGSFKKTEAFLERLSKEDIFSALSKYADIGVAALKENTPSRTGATAAAWYAEVVQQRGVHKIIFCNGRENEGQLIAILIQYGHGTATGGYVEGIDYINPIIRPLFQQIADDVWKAVTI